MVTIDFYWCLLGFMALQRLSEIVISKINAAWMRQHGGKEFSSEHFTRVVMVMVLFFIGIPVEHWLRQTQLSSVWPFLFGLYLVAQVIRYWAMLSLGRFWNARIWVIPGAPRVVKGPYRWIPHPNYVVVAIELITISLMLQCYITCLCSMIGFIWFLRVRIPAEEKALALLR